MLLHGHNLGLILTFISFVVSIFFFGGLYFLLYKKERTYFSYNSEILARQIGDFRAFAHEQLKLTTSQIQILREAIAALDGGSTFVSINGVHILLLSSGASCEMEYEAIKRPGPGPAHQVLTKTTLRDSRGTDLGTLVVSHHQEPKVTCVTLMNRIEKERNKLADKISTLGMEIPDVWSFWDFLYFSAITQTTVGYGDILPNSTPVRILVIFQVLVGYAMLIVVLNIVLTQ